MDLGFLLNLSAIIISIILVGLVVIQQQESGFYSDTANINRTKRGTEKLVFNLTIIFGILFIVVSLINLFL